MRRFIRCTIPLIVLLSACRNSTGPTETGALVFHLDAGCVAGTIGFSLDGTVVGYATLQPGGTYPVSAVAVGDHLATATEEPVNGPAYARRYWAPQPVTIESGRTVMVNLACAVR